MAFDGNILKEALIESDKRKAEATDLAPLRSDYGKFAESVMQDEDGRPVRLAEIHKSWHEHDKWCASQGLHTGIMAPMGHGKTSDLIGFVPFMLGNNPQLRIKIICGVDPDATDRVQAIRSIIEKNDQFKKVFPQCVQDKTLQWTRHKIFVKRRGHQKDASIDSAAIVGPGTGTRADFILFDDIVTFKNAIQQPATQKKVKEAFKRVWMTRLEPGARVYYICTAWTDQDLTQQLLKNKGFGFLRQRVSDDFTHITSENLNTKKITKISLWDARWTKEALMQKYVDIGAQAFDQGYRNKPFSESERTFPHFPGIIDYDRSIADIRRNAKSIAVFTGVDPAGPKRRGTAIFTGAVIDGEYSIPLDIRLGAYKGAEIVQQIKSVYAAFKPMVICVEDNALQTILVDWMKTEKMGLPIRGFTTGVNKNNQHIGIQSMDVRFSCGLWVAPMAEHDHRENPDCICPWCEWLNQFNGHPFSDDTDLVMATWFFDRISAKMNASSGPVEDSVQLGGERTHGDTGQSASGDPDLAGDPMGSGGNYEEKMSDMGKDW